MSDLRARIEGIAAAAMLEEEPEADQIIEALHEALDAEEPEVITAEENARYRAALLTEPYEVPDVPDGSAIVTVPGHGDKPFDLAEPEQPVAVPLRAALEKLPRLRLSGDQMDVINPPDDTFTIDWDEYDEFVRLDDVLAALAVEAVRPETESGRPWRELRELLREELAERPCEVVHSGYTKGWTCLDKQREAANGEGNYVEAWRATVAAGAVLCFRCKVRAALAATGASPDARYTVTVKDEETGAVRDVYHLDADDIAFLTGAPARDEPGIDPERLARAMEESFTVEDQETFVDDTTFWVDYAPRVVAAYSATPLAERPE